jgi:ferredoxin--NADP+ reductase
MDPTFLKPPTNVVSPFEPIEVTIASNTSCMRGKSASFVQHIEFDLTGTVLENTFKPGQSIGVTPPGMDALGRPEGARLYSISSPSFGEDGAGKIVTTTCKRLIDGFDPQYGEGQVAVSGLHLGVCSNYLCGLSAGDTVLVSGPSGKKFCLPEAADQHNYVFVATGTGIAPYRGMVKELLYGPQGPTERQIHVLMGVSYTSDLLYDDFFREAASTHSNLHYHTVVSREYGIDGARQGYVHDYLKRTPEIGDGVLGQEETLLYMCGLKGMQVGVYQYLAMHGLEDVYLRIPKPLIGTDPNAWTALDARRIRPKSRCLVEVY